MNEMIKSSEISILFQGAVDKVNTPKALKSIRKLLPESEIIISTWEGTATESLDCDVIVLNEDPGGFQDQFNSCFCNNTLRQIVSAQTGLKRVTRKYVIKMRMDLILKSCNFLKYYDSFPDRDPNYIIFHHRIIACSFFSKKFCSTKFENQPLPFHLSDWFVFGEVKDIQDLYNIPLPAEPSNSWYMSTHPYSGQNIDLLRASHQYAPEQYIFYKACKNKFPEIKFDHYLDYNADNIFMSEKIIANNCIILNPNQFRFICGKEQAGSDRYKLWSQFPGIIPETLERGLYTYNTFVNDYKRYCR